jgi:hypothetical protein
MRLCKTSHTMTTVLHIEYFEFIDQTCAYELTVNLQLRSKCGKKTISDCFNKAGPKTAGTICLDTWYY